MRPSPTRCPRSPLERVAAGATLLALMLAGSAARAAECPVPVTLEHAVASAQQELQRRLDERTGEMDDSLAPPLVAALDAYKESLAAAIDAQLACSDETVAADALQATLAAHLAPSNGAREAGDDSLRLVVRREDTPDPMLLVNAGFDIPCGDDNLLLGYSRENGHWVRSLDWRSKGYTEISGANGDFFRHLRLPGGQLVIAHGTPWCTSRWSRLSIDIVQPRQGDTPQRVLDHVEHGYVRDEVETRLKPSPGGFELRTEVGMLDVDLLTRPGILRYRLDGEALHRVQPAAKSGRDFVDEWLQVGADTAREWSEPDNASESLLAREHLLALEARRDVTLNYGAVRGCQAEPERFQVELELTSEQPLEGGAHRYLAIRQEPGGFTLLSVSDAADPACQGPDLMARR
ncbi:hypothetical protein LJR232_000455 [Aquipseudomonas alcaligenes]